MHYVIWSVLCVWAKLPEIKLDDDDDDDDDTGWPPETRVISVGVQR